MLHAVSYLSVVGVVSVGSYFRGLQEQTMHVLIETYYLIALIYFTSVGIICVFN